MLIILSKLANNGQLYIDTDRDGLQIGVDTYIHLYKKNSSKYMAQLIASNDDSSVDRDDGSSHSYDLYLSQSPAEGEYLLAVGNYTFSSANALSGRNSAGSYPNGGAYQATFNQEMNFIEYPENANINLYGSDHYNFYVLNNDLDPYSVAGLRILNPVIVDENGTESVFAGACRK